jgi:hypothetical protein
VHKKLRPQRQSYQDLVPTGIMPLPSFAPGAARSFTRNSLYIKVIQFASRFFSSLLFAGEMKKPVLK